jgi:hypothetical protein
MNGQTCALTLDVMKGPPRAALESLPNFRHEGRPLQMLYAATDILKLRSRQRCSTPRAARSARTASPAHAKGSMTGRLAGGELVSVTVEATTGLCWVGMALFVLGVGSCCVLLWNGSSHGLDGCLHAAKRMRQLRHRGATSPAMNLRPARSLAPWTTPGGRRGRRVRREATSSPPSRYCPFSQFTIATWASLFAVPA